MLCQEGYSLNENVTKEYEYCKRNENTKCGYIQNGTCKSCLEGYYLNNDNNCYEITNSNNKNNTNIKQTFGTHKSNKVEFLLYSP